MLCLYCYICVFLIVYKYNNNILNYHKNGGEPFYNTLNILKTHTHIAYTHEQQMDNPFFVYIFLIFVLFHLIFSCVRAYNTHNYLFLPRWPEI